MKKVAIGVAAVLVVVLLLVLLGDDTAQAPTAESNPNTTQTDTQAGPDQQTTPETDDVVNDQNVREIAITMSNYAFSVSEITASPGETITINLSNSGGTHDLVIDELDVASAVIVSGQTTSVTFTVPESAAGQTLSYYCSIGNHRQQGMEGLLVISS
jgi:plastocyanin